MVSHPTPSISNTSPSQCGQTLWPPQHGSLSVTSDSHLPEPRCQGVWSHRTLAVSGVRGRPDL